MSPPPAPRADATIDDLVRATIARAADQLLRHQPDLGDATDPEPVHQFRVATRRLRSDLQTFAPFLDPAASRARRDELRWLGGEVGRVRDGDVLAARLRIAADALPTADAAAAGSLIRLLEHDTAIARRELTGLVTGPRATALLTALEADRDAPPYRSGHESAARLTPAADEAAHLVGRPWRRLHRAVHALPEVPTDAELHQVRIRAKRARYAAEALEPAVGRPAHRFARRVADLQDVLGDHQDTVVAEAWLRNVVAAAAPTDEGAADGPLRLDPTTVLAAGELIGAERATRAEQREAWPEAWARVSRPKLRAWFA